MKKILLRILSLCLSIALLGTAGCKTDNENKKEDMSGQIIPDITYDNGFVLTGFDSRPSLNQRDIGRINYGNDKLEPVWRVGQWGCKSNLVNAKESVNGDIRTYDDGSKKLVINRKTGGFRLDINGSKDGLYADGDRENFDPWIHFIMEVPVFPRGHRLQDMSSMTMYLEFNVEQVENKCVNYNKDLHTALLIWYLAITDRSENTPTSGQYFWFGLPIYDYRYEYSPFFAQQDGGKEDATTSFIYNPRGQDFLDAPVMIGVPQMLSKNVYPMIVEAFNLAQERGFMQKDGVKSKFSDLEISLTSLGWELPGTFDVKLNVDKMGIYVE